MSQKQRANKYQKEQKKRANFYAGNMFLFKSTCWENSLFPEYDKFNSKTLVPVIGTFCRKAY